MTLQFLLALDFGSSHVASLPIEGGRSARVPVSNLGLRRS